MKIFTLLVILFHAFATHAQVGIGTTTPNESSLLDLESSSKGALIPRLTATQKSNISNPTRGLLVYCTNCCLSGGTLTFYNGTSWENIIDCISRQVLPDGAFEVVANANDFIVVMGNDGNLYAWGNHPISNNKSLGVGINNSIGLPKTPTAFANPNNLEFIQITSAHLGSTIALSFEGFVYGAGLSSKGSGNFGDPNEFTKIQLGESDTKAIILGSCEGGSIAVGENHKAYIWGYDDGSNTFGAWAGTTPKEVSFPSGVSTADISSAGGSFHYLGLASKTKVYFTGVTELGIHSQGAWAPHASTFNHISKVRFGRNMVMVEDLNGLHLFDNMNTHLTVDLSAITDSIIKKTTNGVNKDLFIVTANTVYYKRIPTDMSGAIAVPAPVGFEIENILVNNITSNWVLVKLRQTSNNSVHYYGFFVGAGFNPNIGDFTGSNVMQSLNLVTTGIPNGVELKW